MPKAVEYALNVADQVPGMDELLQMSIIEVIKLDCKQDSIHRVSSVIPHLEVLFTCGIAPVYLINLGAPQRLISCRQIRSRNYPHLSYAKPCCSKRYLLNEWFLAIEI